jgi:hypothetical protein
MASNEGEEATRRHKLLSRPDPQSPSDTPALQKENENNQPNKQTNKQTEIFED